MFTGVVAITRREWLVGAGVLGAFGLICVADTAPVRRTLGWTGPDGVVPDVPPADVVLSKFHSAARGREVELAMIAPPLGNRSALPVCLVLHGRGGSARSMVELGLPKFLTALDNEYKTPFVMVAVDGDAYWTGPSMWMLTDELPGWLQELDLRLPAAALGISMGGFGALALACERNLDAVAVISPALFPSWEDAARIDGFPDQKTWEDYEPLRHVDDILPDTKVAVWCGREDPFYDAASQFAELADPWIAEFDNGEHTPGYWHRVLPDALSFIGDQLRG